ncbi:unnamed protein product [Cylicocyclus nassatus]|uniref:Transmembrane protein n=1 Tax=Cylicocyclus nassatus TaxID=53992 RepID=A0AA36GG63_CYLNA|nr:unnamed protein product [Cylicocyclus nassatus]
MSSGSDPLKYLLSYPFSVLTVAKTHILILSVFTVCAWQWRSHPADIGLALFVVPIFHLLSCAAALISLWFMVQKFYWRNVEMGLDITGLVLIVSASFVLTVTGSAADFLRGYVMVNNMFVIIAWSFCLFWCRLCTSNNVSNLFISEWGRATDDIEIEALENHF